MNIHIQTELPNKKDKQLIEELLQYEARSMHGQLPVVWDKAHDFSVYDRHGNKFLDFTSGICVTNSGHGNTNINNALRKKINKPLIHSYTFPTVIRKDYIKKLVKTCYPSGKAFLMSSGTEATECAVKLMRLHGIKKGLIGNNGKIVSLKGSMHGRTAWAEQFKCNDENSWTGYNEIIYNLPEPFDHFYLPNLPDNISGFIIESYRGWDAYFYPENFIHELMEFANKNNIPVCFDEIQGGFGRTGKMFAFEHYNLRYNPDLICLGKGISSSVPLSAVIGRKELLDLPDTGSMSSTHSANPLSCVAGLANINSLKEMTVNAEKLGNILHSELNKLDFKINGHGLLAAIVTNTEEEADNIVWECFKKGLLLIWTHKNSVKIAPPLSINENALMEGIEIINKVIDVYIGR